MAASAILFATMSYFVRRASETLAWPITGAVRALVGGLVAVAIARSTGATLVVARKRVMWVRTVLGTCAMGFLFAALASPGLTLADTATLSNLSPVLIAVCGPLVLRERAGRGSALALCVSGAGVVIVLHPSFLFGGEALSAAGAKAASLALLSACFSAAAMLALRRVSGTESPEAIAAHFSFSAAATFGVISIFVWTTPSTKDVIYMLSAGVAAGLAQVSMTRAYSRARAARVAPVGYLNVVATAVFGATALGEWPRAFQIFGMALVILGGVISALPSFRAEARKRADEANETR